VPSKSESGVREGICVDPGYCAKQDQVLPHHESLYPFLPAHQYFASAVAKRSIQGLDWTAGGGATKEPFLEGLLRTAGFVAGLTPFT
jgi:hypothetical protein